MFLNLIDIAPGAPAEERALIWIITAIVMLPLIAFLVAMYVLHARGLYIIAKRRGIHHPYLAWLPVGQDWLLGCISDQFQYVAQGKRCHNRKILLGLSAPVEIMGFLLYIYLILMPLQFRNTDLIFQPMFLNLPTAVSAAVSVLSLALMVFRAIAKYYLFYAAMPHRRVAFLLLCIFIEQATPILIFAARNRDDGMPPRIVSEPQ